MSLENLVYFVWTSTIYIGKVVHSRWERRSNREKLTVAVEECLRLSSCVMAMDYLWYVLMYINMVEDHLADVYKNITSPNFHCTKHTWV